MDSPPSGSPPRWQEMFKGARGRVRGAADMAAHPARVLRHRWLFVLAAVLSAAVCFYFLSTGMIDDIGPDRLIPVLIRKFCEVCTHRVFLFVAFRFFHSPPSSPPRPLPSVKHIAKRGEPGSPKPFRI